MRRREKLEKKEKRSRGEEVKRAAPWHGKEEARNLVSVSLVVNPPSKVKAI